MYSREQALEATCKYFDVPPDDITPGIFLNKYALKNSDGEYLELTPDDMHKRMAKEFHRIELKYPNPVSYQEIYDAIKNFSKIIPQGSPMAAIGNDLQIQSTSNCFVIGSPKDSYGGILLTDQEEAQLMKRRAGVGTDVSHIRPKGMPTKNAARTTDGIGVFMERFSNTCREVAQGGRRGALLLSISVEHPEVDTFITIKDDKTKVTGANISIRLTDKFMNAVKNDEYYEQKWPVDSDTPEIVKSVKARDVWNKIIHHAWKSAEPGVLFWDNVINNGPADIYEQFRSTSTNPCFAGDQLLLTDNGYRSFKELAETDPFQNIYTDNRVSFTGTDEKESWTIDCSQTGTTIYPSKVFLTQKDVNVYTLKFSNGTTLSCTEDHHIATTIGMVMAKDLTDDHDILTISYEFEIGHHNHNSDPTTKLISYEFRGVEDVYCLKEMTTRSCIVNGIVARRCGEITLSPYDSCRLIAMNLLSFVKNPYTNEAFFDYDDFSKHVQLAQRMMDDLIDLELEKIDTIIAKINSDKEPDDIKYVELNLWNKVKKSCTDGRRTGLGVTALGDALAALGIKYGSDESIVKTEDIYKSLAINSHTSSVIMASERGSFPAFDLTKEIDHPYLKKIVDNFTEDIKNLYKSVGRRNVALTTTPPTGSVSILTQTTSGIEPAFLLAYKRRRKVTGADVDGKVDFVDPNGDKWIQFDIYHHELKRWMEVTGKTNIEESPWFGATANDVDWIKSVDLQAAAQRWVDHSISKTCNLPANTSEDLVAQIYMRAWESGCKGFTIYRDGCRDGVLYTENKKTETESFLETTAKKRPDILPCDVHHVKIKGESWVILIGKDDVTGKPYEVFGGKSNLIHIPKKITSGFIKKTGKNSSGSGCYDLVFGDIDDPTVIKDIVTTFENKDQGDFTRILSFALRHGGPIHYAVEVLQKSEGSDMYSFSRVIARVLKSYVKDGTSVKSKCTSCGSTNLIYQENCLRCVDCGHSKCS